jgi:hypothetical protein
LISQSRGLGDVYKRQFPTIVSLFEVKNDVFNVFFITFN